jgi:hypothetical protein
MQLQITNTYIHMIKQGNHTFPFRISLQSITQAFGNSEEY